MYDSQTEVPNYNPTAHSSSKPKNTQSDFEREVESIYYAGFGLRFLSYIIDLLMLWGITSIILKPIYSLTKVNEAKFFIDYLSVDHIMDALFYFLYFILMTYFFKQTIGKMILGISVQRKDFRKLKWGDVLIREWPGRIISNIFLGLPYLVVLFTHRHEGIHDFFADTVVVKQKYLKQLQNR
ncbi:RDD family protein [Staphylococcus massiliensis]|uniref:RDD family protein n=1 Tax=Staphylococcus massiliensis S46 TaxID=1229783 RepID=K9B8V9_9STAP|nr:RDD family protein [Staphylococcus massiliensis]EKU50220.1 RDD family protein [Staphylococcus massiliensis S46]MCG3399753.1 RDD family protein [Staphylococcus massiliensis]MCG3400858.1 RDD family protein [Staphylococcus massiliensis]MCG3411978.1 RDD family protein [Staphylococcus massiliensis]PNZ99999.1 RDD family protein [Staphylococcus massiliensis CCUG 55927]